MDLIIESILLTCSPLAEFFSYPSFLEILSYSAENFCSDKAGFMY